MTYDCVFLHNNLTQSFLPQEMWGVLDFIDSKVQCDSVLLI